MSEPRTLVGHVAYQRGFKAGAAAERAKVAPPLTDERDGLLREAAIVAALRFQSQAEHRIQSEFCPACGTHDRDPHGSGCSYSEFVMALVALSPDERQPLDPDVMDRTAAADMTDDQYRAWMAAGHPARMPRPEPDERQPARETNDD